jgi:hypothetical protein
MSKKFVYLVCFVLVLSIALTSAANAADPNLMGWWKFDGDALDSSGNERHGTLNGSPTFGPGVFGQALECQANPDYVTIDGYKGILGTHAFSITAWVKTTNTAIEQIVHWGAHADGQRVEFRINNNMLRISHGGGNVQGNTDLTDGEWYHVAVTVIDNATASSGDVTFYVDGQDDTIESTDPDGWDIVANATLDVTIGWRPTQQDRPFIGSIDDVRIYDKVLTQDEILAIMEGGGEAYPFAMGPDPVDGALLEDTWANLSWRAGDFAVSHDVYIGENFDDVNDGAESTFQGNQAATKLIVGFPGMPLPDGLVPGTTYYWRIDEVNEADPNSPWKGNVWSFTIPPRTAYDLIPADGAKFIDPNVELGWTAGFNAKLHYVFFGDNFDDVNNAVAGLPQSEITYSPGTLELDRVYYWRIDEFDGVSTHKGDVLSFRTLPEIPITDPNLMCWWTLEEGSGTTAVDWSGHGNHGEFNGNPQWVPGYDGYALHFVSESDRVVRSLGTAADWPACTVAFWVKPDTLGQNTFSGMFSSHVPNSAGFQVDVDGGNPGYYRINPGDLLFGTVTTSWVHLAVVCDGTFAKLYNNGYLVASGTLTDTTFNQFAIGTNRNAVNSLFGIIDDFRIYDKVLTDEEIQLTMRGDPLLAWGPKPTPGSTLYIRDATPLSWSAGDNASQHDVYFGTDRDAVADANASDTTGIYRGRQGITIYTPPEGVEWGGGPYYWRVDEYNTDATISKGRIWSFTVTDFIGIDDFEDYNDYEPDRIFETWIDGWGVETNGSEVGYAEPNFPDGEHHVETTIVHGGGQSMPYFYENNFKYSEATMTLVWPRNWTEEGVGVLSLWFYGDTSNAAELMYVNLNGIATVYHDNPDAALINEWTEWTIDLQEFAAKGVNLANVNTISIGFGDKNNLQAGGSGLVFFDDIRLYRLAEPEQEAP